MTTNLDLSNLRTGDRILFAYHDNLHGRFDEVAEIVRIYTDTGGTVERLKVAVGPFPDDFIDACQILEIL